MRYFLILVACLTSCQSLVFPSRMAANRLSAEEIAVLRPPMREIALKRSFGWYFEAGGSERRRAMVMFHGNAETVDDYAHWATAIAKRGTSVLLVEFPGYRGAGGKAGQRSIAGVGGAAYDWLRDEGYAAEEILVFGRSIGAGAACDLTRTRDVRRLILVSAFTTLGEAAKEAGFPKIAGLGRFNNRKTLRKYKGRLLIVHGSRDELLLIDQARELFDEAGSEAGWKEFLMLDAGHNDLLAGFERELTENIVRLGEDW